MAIYKRIYLKSGFGPKIGVRSKNQGLFRKLWFTSKFMVGSQNQVTWFKSAEVERWSWYRIQKFKLLKLGRGCSCLCNINTVSICDHNWSVFNFIASIKKWKRPFITNVGRKNLFLCWVYSVANLVLSVFPSIPRYNIILSMYRLYI